MVIIGQQHDQGQQKIPFVFHGPRHSRPEPDKLPLADIIATNLDHYRLDADYKHGLHFASLPTAWVSGFDKDAELRIGSSTIRLAASTNGVSRLHGEVSSGMWRHLFPDGAGDPVGYVTNGVHTASWVGPEMRTFYTQHVDPAWEQKLLEPEAWQKVREAPDAALWSAHRAQKERLIRFVRERVRVQSARHGLSPDELRQVELEMKGEGIPDDAAGA